MRRRTKRIVVAGAVVAGLAAGGVGVAVAGGAGGRDTDTPITGPDRQRASDAALQHMGGGRVTGTEVGDEESYYEVEVTSADGSQTDVQLDRNFNVVGQKTDGGDHREPSVQG